MKSIKVIATAVLMFLSVMGLIFFFAAKGLCEEEIFSSEDNPWRKITAGIARNSCGATGDGDIYIFIEDDGGNSLGRVGSIPKVQPEIGHINPKNIKMIWLSRGDLSLIYSQGKLLVKPVENQENIRIFTKTEGNQSHDMLK